MNSTYLDRWRIIGAVPTFLFGWIAGESTNDPSILLIDIAVMGVIFGTFELIGRIVQRKRERRWW